MKLDKKIFSQFCKTFQIKGKRVRNINFVQPFTYSTYLYLIDLLIEVRGSIVLSNQSNIKDEVLKNCFELFDNLCDEKAQMFKQRVQKIIEVTSKLERKIY